MTQNKLVSVCINAYNSEKYIAETIESVINQTYQNLQIIVVDDASTDSTAEIVKSFDDPRIELYTLEKNGHISNANNETYRKIRGEYMVHTDSDDILNPDLIEKTVGYLESHPECGAAFCWLSLIDQNGSELKIDHVENVFRVTAKTQADFVRLFFDSLNHLSHTGATIRKSVIDDIGFHNYSHCYLHDFDYWTRLVLKYPIHIIGECLAKYRLNLSDEHNSHLDETQKNAHDIELARIIYRMIDNCPDELFIEAFADRLRLEGKHTPEEIKLEKAFLLQDGLKSTFLSQNKILSVVMLAELFQDKKYVDIARDKFNFTVRDFYKLQSSETLYDQVKFDTKQHEFNLKVIDLSDNIVRLRSAVDDLNQALQQKHIEFANVVELCDSRLVEIERLSALLEHKQNILNKTVEYRVAKLLKKAYHALKHIKHFCALRDKNGKKYRKCVMIYGYYGVNLGDDLFFEKLITRYPDTMFFVYYNQNYRAFFERFDNVKFYACEDPLVCKIVGWGNKHKIYDLFELLLLKRSNASVHIGGSIYQQVGDYELDYKLRKRRKQPFKPFYSISCNFGTYNTEDFKIMWRKQFKKYKDICFRDKYSYDLFSDLKCVRQAPDLLFSYKFDTVEEISGSVAISVLDPFIENRGIDKAAAEAYCCALNKTVCDLVNSNKKVTLVGFCDLEGDGAFISKLLDRLPENIREAVGVVNYSFDTKAQTLNALSSAEYIIGTRLHSVVLGMAMGKKVLPITYNKKINYILGDIGYNQPVIKIDEINEYQNTGFAKLLETVSHFDVSGLNNSDDLQFAKLDKFLK